MEQNINKAVHSIVLQHIKAEHITIDATCGNGHDTLLLAQHSTHVFAFDIQPEAIINTKQLLDEHHRNNVTYIEDSHEYLSRYVKQPVHIIMYNLGYLPYSDHLITTNAISTLQSIKEGLSLLAIGGLITITIYIGHDGGQEEATAIETFVTTLDKHQYTIVKYEHINRKKAPYLILIEKIK